MRASEPSDVGERQDLREVRNQKAARRLAPLMSSGKDDWRTPGDVFGALDAEFDFDRDVAASAENALCHDYITVERDALASDWLWPLGYQTTCWCNPPYSRGLQAKFIAKAASEREKGVTTVMLLPARTDTKAFHRYIWDAEAHRTREGVEVRFLPGRIKFVGAKHGAPFPSMVVIFRPDHVADRRLR